MENQRHHQDLLLINRIAKGDQEAYTEVYNAYHPVLFQSALRILKLKSVAEDVCSDVFVSLWQKRETLADVQSLKAYLLTSVRNRSLNALKSISRKQELLQQISKCFPGTSMETESRVLDRDYAHFIKEQVSLLPQRSKEIFQMCRDKGYSYEQAATELGISRNAVKNHMVFSMKRLRSFMEKDLGISFSSVSVLTFSIIFF